MTLCYVMFYLFGMDITKNIGRTRCIDKSEFSTSASFHHLSIGAAFQNYINTTLKPSEIQNTKILI